MRRDKERDALRRSRPALPVSLPAPCAKRKYEHLHAADADLRKKEDRSLRKDRGMEGMEARKRRRWHCHPTEGSEVAGRYWVLIDGEIPI